MNKKAVAAALVLAGLVWIIAATRPPPAAMTAAVRAPTAPSAPVLAAPPVPAAPVPAAPAPTLAEQVDALIATRDPQKAYAAYRLLADCASFNRDGDRLIFEAEEALHHKNDGALPGFRAMLEWEKRRDAVLCAPMTERMRLSRIDYLALAAQAGIPAAAIEQATEGPFGDRSALTTRPDDPLVREWKARVHEQLVRIAEEQADIGVLNYLSAMHTAGSDAFDKDAALAYRYGVAMGLIMQDLNGADDAMARLYRADGTLMQGAGASLTMTERAAQLAEAQRIAATARARRQREGRP